MVFYLKQYSLVGEKLLVFDSSATLNVMTTNKTAPSHKKRAAAFIVKMFGALGYLSVFFQWGWALLLYSPLYVGIDFLQPEAPREPVMAQSSGDPSLALVLFAGVITLAAIVATIFVFIKIPASTEKAGAKITQSAAKVAIPVITHHKKVSKTRQRILTRRIIVIAKCALVVVPLIAIFPARWIDEPVLEPLVMLLPALLFAVISAICFGAQYATAWGAKIAPELIR